MIPFLCTSAFGGRRLHSFFGRGEEPQTQQVDLDPGVNLPTNASEILKISLDTRLGRALL